ncbi:hypothetical protein [Consotaella salsifontis]|uniref:Curlin associated repeat-containing protein n=1 Tax=Consotaella salsifontis TaxID=1365950 RepID=A0A1T4SF90_9HYPH|nr:hypothetical protein [Consotaella salsifontis]SKA26845.1 Curlin associated repeat-containing protein [Consotaella salsifontis]
MKRMRACLAVAALLTAFPAAAENSLVILSDPGPLNATELTVAGSGNSLMILQEAPLNAAAMNSIRVSLTGNGNGGPAGSSFTGAALRSGLTPGSLTQKGQGNLVSLGVIGSHNLFAMLQQGDGNTIAASISGTGNQAAVQQFGGRNYASFSQTGMGNNVSIIQRSR